METVNRILAPKNPATNTDTNLLKVVAMVSMLLDHAGKMLFSTYPVFRILGRLAFPIYAYCLAMGVVYTKHPLRYIRRMVLLALISQPLYALGLGHTNSAMYSISFAEHPVQAVWNFYVNSWKEPSILLALTCGLILLWAIRNREIVFAIAAYLFCWKIQNYLDYGMNGIHLMLLFYLLCEHPAISAVCVTAFMAWWGLSGGGYNLFGAQFSLQMFALAVLPLIYIPTNSGVKLPKWLFYAFYPAHLALLWFLTAGF